ncbi:MAG: TlyA family RNA methyltransferase [Firmicutes bacterium]|nr:TlyA family RNA methyltransferase [Bacillota bacterium]
MVRCAKKKRLDELLVDRGLLENRRAAMGYIMAGKVLVDGHREDKPGTLVPADADVRVKGIDMPFVGRGGLKLDHALRQFGLDVSGRVVLDAGASTGGFTDCLLQRGARLVYAVDVGFGQLAGKLRASPAVVCLERTNISDLDPEDLVPPPEMAVVDLSYLSLTKAVPIVARLVAGQGDIVALVKPLFEDSRPAAADDPDVHREVLARLVSYFDHKGFGVMGLTSSPVLGNSGTAEFLVWVSKSREHTRVAQVWSAIPDVVAAAQQLRLKDNADEQSEQRQASGCGQGPQGKDEASAAEYVLPEMRG